MSYFIQNHDDIRYAIAVDGRDGLRKSQIGALHAISAHFSLHEQPAVVVLPTGAGKTAVLMLTPFILRAQRVLVLTQSRFVRDQITQDYQALRTLKTVRALPQDLPPPTLYENKHLVGTGEAWEAFRQYDGVISTPSSASPAKNHVATPPEDLFDLVLVDEAHHSPAPTWNALIEAFPRARCVLFTATPFRRDGKEIKGKYIYTYPIQRAYDDGIYGDMIYIPVEPTLGTSADMALAREAERVFRQDAANGFAHILMVRADSLRRATQLEAVYTTHTGLSLGVVDSGKSQRKTEAVVQQLRHGELDGVICVNMLGEGFDLPNLKIAALHAPHRSLAVTLQFFGRFARVNGDCLGEAKFLAVQSEIGGPLEDLFQESEAWGKRIQTIGQARIGEEESTREFLADFRDRKISDHEADLSDLSLYGFHLFNHVKVYQVVGDVRLDAFPELLGFVTEKVWGSELRSTVAFLLREEIRPKWVSTDGLNQVEHHMFVVYHDKPTGLLFICATYREEWAYKEIASLFTEGFRPISLGKTSRALRSFSDLELFNVGMRNRKTGVVAESYRQIAGSAVHDAIDKGDGLLYHRGHVFGRGRTPKGISTIGLSSLSKIWRLNYTKIPVLVEWCQSLANDIQDPAPFTTGIALDHLDAGCDATAIPDQVVLGVDWQEDVYQNPPFVRFRGAEGVEKSVPLLEFDLRVDLKASGTEVILVEVQAEVSTRLKFSFSPLPTIEYENDAQPRWQIEKGPRILDFADYLTDNPLRFHLADGSLLEGGELFESQDEDEPYDAASLMEVADWSSAGVNIEKEYDDPKSPKPGKSIQDWLGNKLIAGDAPVVFFDHRSGECADYLTVSVDGDGKPAIRLYHCKASGGVAPGDRVDDLYEVCGQATKSSQWRAKKVLLRQVKSRFRSGSSFSKGDLDTFSKMIGSHARYEFPLEIFIVQPGVSKSALSIKMSTLLSVTSRGLVASGCQRLRVICSP